MKILFADRLEQKAIDKLRAAGDLCEVNPSLNAESLTEHIDGTDVLVVRSTKVTAATLEKGTRLGMVLRAGAGTNNIDAKRAGELGIFVCNVPGRNAIAVAELAIGLMFAIDRHIAPATAELQAGDWNKQTYSQARGLYGSTLGIIGMGAIGLHVAQRASACGLEVITVANPNRSPNTLQAMAEIGVTEVPNREALLAASDIVSLHVPADAGTKGMVDSAFLAALKPDAVLINTSRGELVDETALLAALNTSDLRAGLDVFANEPASGTGKFVSELARHPKVTATHHIGASTQQAQAAVADGVAEIIDAYRAGEVLYCVNLETAPKRTATLSIRHYNRVGVLACVLQEMSSRGLNVANMQNRILSGSEAAVALIEVSGAVTEELLALLSNLTDVICVTVQEASTLGDTTLQDSQ